MLRVERLSSFYGEATALREVDLEVADGELVSVVGPNGAGKTTLVGAIAGLVTDRSGRIVLDGIDLLDVRRHEVCEHGIAVVPEGRRLFAGMSVRENLLLGGYRRTARPEREERLARVHDLFPVLDERAEQRAGTLSGGEQQMLALGRALMASPRLLLLDEPSLGLAPVVVDTVFDALRAINAEGVAILLVEQNVTRALAVSARGYLLNEGTIVRSGAASAMLDDPELRRICLGI